MFTLIVLVLSAAPDGAVTETKRVYPFEGITACERALSSFKADAGAGMAVTAVCVPRVEK